MSLSSTSQIAPAIPVSRSRRHGLETPQKFWQIAFRNVLFCTDFSAPATRALPYAVEIARRSAGTIHVLHVIPPAVSPAPAPEEWLDLAREEDEFRQRMRQELETEIQDLQHEFRFPTGDVWENVQRAIMSENIDLIVLGTHGRTGIAKAVMGSVTEKIFRQARCPVLTVGPNAATRARHATAAEFNTILYATDFTPDSFTAARYATCMAKEHRAELILVHATSGEDSEQSKVALETLLSVVPCGSGLQSKPLCLVEPGPTAEAILKIASERHADLIVLGVRGAGEHPDLEAHTPGSTAYDVVSRAACPVLTARS